MNKMNYYTKLQFQGASNSQCLLREVHSILHYITSSVLISLTLNTVKID